MSIQHPAEKKSRILSFCLYGDAPRFVAGLAENIALAPAVYPGWRIIAYVDRKRPDLDCEQIVCGPSAGAAGMFWRIRAAAIPVADAILFRDADSRLSEREAAAVNAWLVSGMLAHSIHDHKYHRPHPLMGGMWGVRGGMFPDIEQLIAIWCAGRGLGWGDDQTFLEHKVYPRVAESCLHHSSVEIRWLYRALPALGPGEPFIGQQIDDAGQPIWP